MHFLLWHSIYERSEEEEVSRSTFSKEEHMIYSPSSSLRSAAAAFSSRSSCSPSASVLRFACPATAKALVSGSAWRRASSASRASSSDADRYENSERRRG